MPDRDQLALAVEDTFRNARASGLSIADAADLVAAAIRTHLTEAAEADTRAAGHVHVQSILGMASGLPLVQCRVGWEQWEWDVEQARQHAFWVLACAEAAEHDAAVWRWLTLGPIGMDSGPAAAAIQDLRRFRGQTDAIDWRLPAHDQTGG